MLQAPAQDEPEVQSSGVPVPSEDNRFHKNRREMHNFSTDMPWNPYQALLHARYYAPESIGPGRRRHCF